MLRGPQIKSHSPTFFLLWQQKLQTSQNLAKTNTTDISEMFLKITKSYQNSSIPRVSGNFSLKHLHLFEHISVHVCICKHKHTNTHDQP